MNARNDDNITIGPNGLTATAQYLWDDEKIVLEIITQDDPMTPARAHKIEFFRKKGYDVVIFDEDTFSSFEAFDSATIELGKKLGQYGKKELEELDKYKGKRRQVFNELFRDGHSFFNSMFI